MREDETMNPTIRLTDLRWGMISLLAAIGLVRPLLSITGLYASLMEAPWRPSLSP
jgi:hypothetical protein